MKTILLDDERVRNVDLTFRTPWEFARYFDDNPTDLKDSTVYLDYVLGCLGTPNGVRVLSQVMYDNPEHLPDEIRIVSDYCDAGKELKEMLDQLFPGTYKNSPNLKRFKNVLCL